jgi:L-ribulose-5-phosphate 3-epimerase
MQIRGHDIAVCNWSLHAGGQELVDLTKGLGLSHIQLALGGFLYLDDEKKKQELAPILASAIAITAGMIGFPGEDYSTIARIRVTGGFMPDEVWPLRRQITLQAGEIAQSLGLKILTTHIGFVPPSNHEDYGKLLGRVGEVAGSLRAMGVQLLLETGQEAAPELLQFLNDVPGQTLGVNFDPANMFLYGAGDPIAAIRILDRHIKHVHVKDAKPSKKPGIEWGVEVPFGTGAVDVEQFLIALDDVKYTGPLAIEREAGPSRLADVKAAIGALGKFGRR